MRVQPYGAFICFGRRTEGVQGASGKPPASSGVSQLCCKKSLPRGLTRRLRRGSGTCRPMGLSHFSFDGERKVCKRKPAARRLRERALYCPFWRRGSLCRAQHNWPDFTCDPARSELAFFPPSKWAGLFPSAAYRRPRPRSWVYTYSNFAGWDASMQLGYFCNAKCQRGFKSTLAFLASHEARCRMAVYISQLTGNRTRPASREARRRAAVIQRPSRFPSSIPAPCGGGVGCRGSPPARGGRRWRSCREEAPDWWKERA